MKHLFYFIIILGAILGVRANAADSYVLTDSDSSALITNPVSEPSYLHLLERGPIREFLSLAESFATDPSGNKWGVYVIEQRVYVITSDGKFFWVAGTGAAGFRDGPAHRAMFNMGGNGYDYGDIDADSRGNAYIPDASNNRIRKVSKQADGTWIVSTLAGGGARRLNPGETAPATEAWIPTPLAVAVDSFDNVWFFDYRALYKVAAGIITAYSRTPDQRAEHVNVVDMEADELGNIYAITRANSASMLWKITQDGKIHWAAGISQAEWDAFVKSSRKVPVDGPADNASFFATGSITVEPDGSAVYVGGGDELVLRRYKEGRVSKLSTTGTWIESQSRGGGVEVGAIAGIDSLGRIYGRKQPWRPPDQNQWTALRMLVPSNMPPDTTPPAVSITSPANGATVSTIITISAIASDNVAVASVQFKLDGANLGSEDTTSPYSITWNTTLVSNGSHSLTAVARDTAGNQGTSGAVSVMVNNIGVIAPTVTLSASQTTITPGGSATLSWSSTNTTTCTASGAWSGTKAISGSQSTGALTTTSTFTLSCTGTGGRATQSVTVTVNLNTTKLDNNIVITEKEGKSQTNYPVQVGHPFRSGEIKNFPQAILDGAPIQTQANVKTRWPDGSVKHAILNFVLPTLAANSSVTITFQNQNSGGAPSGKTPPPTGVSAAFSGLGTASCNGMVSKSTLWLDGPIATTWILADHQNKFFDLGLVRPICEVTQWHTLGKTFVRFIAEIADTEKQNDTSYNVTLQPSGETAPVYHQAGTRWTRTFWIGGAPSKINIDHNLAYLESTNAIPNYDISKTISAATISSAYSQWLNSNRGFSNRQWDDIGGYGNLTPAMGNAGSRPELGPYPTWVIRWLYTGDYRMAEQSLGNADLGARWPMHYREGDSSKSAYGQPIRITDRPTLALASGLNYNYTTANDKIAPLDQLDLSDWRPEIAHQPDLYSIPYMLTGDHWYLEEAAFWASWSAAYPNGAATNSYCGRGPTGKEGGIPGAQCLSIRGQAWAIRNRAQVAWLTPDDTSEKSYFTQLVNDAICIWEGGRQITGTSCEGTPNWNWGKKVDQPKGPHPMHFWEKGGTAFTGEPVDPTKASGGVSTWEQNFLMYSLGRIKELGFPSDALVSWLGQNIAGQIVGPGTNPYIIATYRLPTADKSGNPFTNWSSVAGAYLSSYDFAANFALQLINTDHGYALVGIPAVAASGVQSAWDWIKANALTASGLMNNPKWAIKPRDLSSTVISTKFSIGDRVKTTDKLNARSSPGGLILGTQAVGALGTVVGGPTFSGSNWWWNINYDLAPDGWSTEDFIIGVTTFTVISPNGGESWTAGSIQTIRWSGGNTADRIRIILDTSPNSAYSQIADTNNTGSYNWTVPNTKAKFYIRVCILTSSNLVNQCDTSNAPFSIVAAGTAQKSVILWTDKKTYVVGNTIKFTAKALDADGTPFTPEEGAQTNLNLVSPTGKPSIGRNMNYNYNSGYYESSEPIDQSAEVGNWVVYATVVPRGTSNILATSEKVTLSITSSITPSITVISPNGGEVLTRGKNYVVQWSSKGGPLGPFDVFLVKDGKILGDIGFVGGVDSGSFSWIVGADPISNLYSDGTGYKIRVSNQNGDIYDESNAPFSIVAGTISANPTISSLSNYSGPVGTVLTIRGSNLSGFESDTNIWIENSAGIKGSLGGRSSDGGASVTVTLKSSLCQQENSYSGSACNSFLIVSPGVYKIYAMPWGKKSNVVNFTITSTTGTAKPFITVISPNGGEVWKRGELHTIKWNASTDTTSVSISIHSYQTATLYLYGIFAGTSNDGSQDWMVGKDILGKDIPPGQYVLSIGDSRGLGGSAAAPDSSDAPFSITAAAASANNPNLASIPVVPAGFLGRLFGIIKAFFEWLVF